MVPLGVVSRVAFASLPMSLRCGICDCSDEDVWAQGPTRVFLSVMLYSHIGLGYSSMMRLAITIRHTRVMLCRRCLADQLAVCRPAERASAIASKWRPPSGPTDRRARLPGLLCFLCAFSSQHFQLPTLPPVSDLLDWWMPTLKLEPETWTGAETYGKRNTHSALPFPSLFQTP